MQHDAHGKENASVTNSCKNLSKNKKRNKWKCERKKIPGDTFPLRLRKGRHTWNNGHMSGGNGGCPRPLFQKNF